MTPEDITSGLRICRAVGWNQLARDWELFLQLSPNGCRVAANASGEVAGTVITIRYENYFSWIGMLLVDPAWQEKGIGKNLLTQALQMLSHEPTVKLDATPAGKEVYLKYNFVDEYSISRMMLDDREIQTLRANAKLTKDSDFPEILKLDKEVFGADRKMVLNWMWRAGQQFSFVVKRDDKVVGYSFGRVGYLYAHIGPVIAEDEDVARQLVTSILKNCPQRPIILDVPHNKPHWVTWLQSLGFIEKRTLTRMYRGANSHPGISEKQFAILGPEFG